jgi:hypothetical protein
MGLACLRQLEKRNAWKDQLMDDILEAVAKGDVEAVTSTTTTTKAATKEKAKRNSHSNRDNCNF